MFFVCLSSTFLYSLFLSSIIWCFTKFPFKICNFLQNYFSNDFLIDCKYASLSYNFFSSLHRLTNIFTFPCETLSNATASSCFARLKSFPLTLIIWSPLNIRPSTSADPPRTYNKTLQNEKIYNGKQYHMLAILNDFWLKLIKLTISDIKTPHPSRRPTTLNPNPFPGVLESSTTISS